MTTPDQPNDLRLPRPDLDPARHLLVHTKFEHLPDETAARRPIPLDEAATNGRESIELGKSHEDRYPRASLEIITISGGRAWTIAKLLDELALRLKPGMAVGPIQSDGTFSRLARELADDMYRRIG